MEALKSILTLLSIRDALGSPEFYLIVLLLLGFLFGLGVITKGVLEFFNEE